jgi:Rhs element Vgr protein
MTNTCKSKYFHDATDSDVMEELIDAYGVDKDVESTSVTHKQLVQYNCTDWDFVLCRADVNGMLCITSDGKLSIARPDFSAAEVLTLQYGATVHDLDAEIDARFQYKTVKASTWNFTDQELLDTTESEDPGVPEAGNLSSTDLASVIDEEELRLYHSGKIEEPEMQQWVNAKMMKHQLAKIRGKIKTDGTSVVLPGTIVQLNGAGERFEGKLFVTGVRHEVEKGNWHTVIQFGINPEWFVQTYNTEQPNAGAMLPGIKGLHTGIVTKLESDPDGEDRIQVKIPVINKDDDGTWCRVASLDAGEKRGMYFRPEIDDEVVVGFIDNDPRHAVVLGMLNSSAKPAPITASDDNHEKGYVSRSEMKMIFNDDKKTITVETPGGNKVLISDDEKKIHLEDQNGNKITMSEDGIKLESCKDIIMKATGDMKCEGVNIEVKSSAQAKLEGGSGAEFKSGGTTKVSGSMVQIN